MIREIVENTGYAYLREFNPFVPSHEIAMSLGEVMHLHDGTPVHQLKPLERAQSTPNSYSGIYGLSKFPFHTDLAHWRRPPHYIMLRCLVGYSEVPTFLIDGRAIAQEVGFELLSRSLVQPRRPREGKIPLLRIYRPFEDSGLIRLDDVFVKPAAKVAAIGVSLFRSTMQTHKSNVVGLAARGDTVIIDNWRMLHSRAAVPDACRGRIIERVYMESLN